MTEPVLRQWPRDPRYWAGDDGSILGPSRRELRLACTGKSQYLNFATIDQDGRYRRHSVHVVVAEAWLGLRPAGLEAAHKNGDRTDNRPSNLKWATPLENAADRTLHGRTARGERHGCAKLTEEDVRTLRKYCSVEPRLEAELATRYGVTRQTIRSVLEGKTWTHLR